jgi:hypothetical protein
VARCCLYACSAEMFCGLLGVLPLQLPDPRAIGSNGPGRCPASIWACFALPRSVSVLMPGSSPTRRHAAVTLPASCTACASGSLDRPCDMHEAQQQRPESQGLPWFRGG